MDEFIYKQIEFQDHNHRWSDRQIWMMLISMRKCGKNWVQISSDLKSFTDPDDWCKPEKCQQMYNMLLNEFLQAHKIKPEDNFERWEEQFQITTIESLKNKLHRKYRSDIMQGLFKFAETLMPSKPKEPESSKPVIVQEISDNFEPNETETSPTNKISISTDYPIADQSNEVFEKINEIVEYLMDEIEKTPLELESSQENEYRNLNELVQAKKPIVENQIVAIEKTQLASESFQGNEYRNLNELVAIKSAIQAEEPIIEDQFEEVCDSESTEMEDIQTKESTRINLIESMDELEKNENKITDTNQQVTEQNQLDQIIENENDQLISIIDSVENNDSTNQETDNRQIKDINEDEKFKNEPENMIVEFDQSENEEIVDPHIENQSKKCFENENNESGSKTLNVMNVDSVTEKLNDEIINPVKNLPKDQLDGFVVTSLCEKDCRKIAESSCIQKDPSTIGEEIQEHDVENEPIILQPTDIKVNEKTANIIKGELSNQPETIGKKPKLENSKLPPVFIAQEDTVKLPLRRSIRISHRKSILNWNQGQNVQKNVQKSSSKKEISAKNGDSKDFPERSSSSSSDRSSSPSDGPSSPPDNDSFWKSEALHILENVDKQWGHLLRKPITQRSYKQKSKMVKQDCDLPMLKFRLKSGEITSMEQFEHDFLLMLYTFKVMNFDNRDTCDIIYDITKRFLEKKTSPPPSSTEPSSSSSLSEDETDKSSTSSDKKQGDKKIIKPKRKRIRKGKKPNSKNKGFKK